MKDFSEFKPRLDRAVIDRGRPCLAPSKDKLETEAALRAAGFLDPIRVFEDAYSIRGEIHLVTSTIVEPVDPDWYVLQCAPASERVAASGLHQIGYHPWVPMRRERRPVRAPKKGEPKTKGVDLPLVVGYAFLPLAKRVIPDWRTIEAVHGVAAVLRHNGSPQPILNVRELEELRRLESAGHFDETRARPPKTKRGDTVRITSGPFSGLSGLVSATTEQRVKIVLGALFGSIDVGVDVVEVV